MAPIITSLSLVAALLALQVNAIGYNEGPSANRLGVEQYGSYSSVQLFSSTNHLQLNGVVFGKSGSTRFATWASRQSCTIGGVAYTGSFCNDNAIDFLSYALAEGVRASGVDLYNTGILYGQGQKGSGYRFSEDGQGSSCTTPTTYAQQGSCPTETIASIENSTNVYNFPARGLKVTCKSACGAPDGFINRGNWTSVISQLTQTMYDGDWFAARFAVMRLSNNKVLARCRLTSANIGQFGLDTCPDLVPRSGLGFNNDQQPYP